MAATAVAKVFMNGRSQAVRLPKAFRFDTDEVTVERVGDSIVLRPRRQTHAEWWAQIEAAINMFKGMPDYIERDQTPSRDPPSFD